jgi:thioredoxin-related protein
MRKTLTLLTALMAVAMVSTVHAGEGWGSDFAKAKAEAQESGKPILVNFTGSDWCGWCKKLVKEVFSQDAFKAYAADSLVLFEADFPNQKQLPPEVIKQNKELAKKYAIRGYPTILLLDAEGKVLAKTGYRRGGADAYVTHLKALIAESAAPADKDVSAVR